MSSAPWRGGQGALDLNLLAPFLPGATACPHLYTKCHGPINQPSLSFEALAASCPGSPWGMRGGVCKSLYSCPGSFHYTSLQFPRWNVSSRSTAPVDGMSWALHSGAAPGGSVWCSGRVPGGSQELRGGASQPGQWRGARKLSSDGSWTLDTQSPPEIHSRAVER